VLPERAIMRIGQFSESPVLAVARALRLDEKYDVGWTTERVPSSPSQFQSLQDGTIDLAITSPDNVLLYGTTDKNPITKKLDLKFLRSIDRGLGLALYSSVAVSTAEDFRGATIGVDVPNSGFAFLLFSMLSNLGVERSEYELEAVGATPKRLAAITDGSVVATVLNAETAIAAENVGLKKWSTSTDVSEDYLGTVLVQVGSSQTEQVHRFLDLWEEATGAILSMTAEALSLLLEGENPRLADPNYIGLLQSEDYGILRDSRVSVEQLMILADIRSQFGAFRPSDEAISELSKN
jgi:ABC-type nitrate/sulfonate/bicarbonate transport system substrate-binding protein